MIEGMILLSRGRTRAARQRFKCARVALNEGGTDPQYDPELEILSAAAKIADGEAAEIVDRHLATVSDYVRDRRFLFHADVVCALRDLAAGRPLDPDIGSYARTILEWASVGDAVSPSAL